MKIIKCSIKKTLFSISFAVLLMGFYPTAVKADCDPEYEPNGCDDPYGENIPIDGGALALLAGGAALGYKALKKKREDNVEKE